MLQAEYSTDVIHAQNQHDQAVPFKLQVQFIRWASTQFLSTQLHSQDMDGDEVLKNDI